MAKKKTTIGGNGKQPLNEEGPRIVSVAFLEFFKHLVKNTFAGEKELLKALPSLKKISAFNDLSTVFTQQTEQISKQIERLVQVFNELGQSMKSKKVGVIQAMILEGKEINVMAGKDPGLRDAALVITAQKIDRYQIASYESLIQLAITIKNKNIISLLQQTLTEKRVINDLLKNMAESNLYDSAATEGFDDVLNSRTRIKKEHFESVNLERKS